LALTSGQNSLRLPLNGRQARIELVVQGGDPVINAETTVHSSDSGSKYLVSDHTDEDGVLALPEAPYSQFTLTAYQPLRGLLLEVPVEVDFASSEPVRVLFDTPARLRVACMDGKFVPDGLQLKVSDPTTNYYWNNFSTLPDGTIDFGPCSESNFLVQVTHPGYWPSRTIVRATTGSTPVPMQVRRLGGLTLRVRSAASGQPLVGVAVELDSAEFGTSVATWLAESRVHASSASLATDATGSLRVDGLPNGEYSWRIGGATGAVIVPPHAAATFDLVIP
jgi:hypothetical protein